MGIMGGSEYVIECLGPEGGGGRWLNGDTKSGAALMQMDTTDANSGTRWLALQVSTNAWRFQCQGSLDGSLYLNGITQKGWVNLDSNTDDSGTQWSLSPVPGGSNADFVVTCLGQAGGSTTVLNGQTGNGVVVLASDSTLPGTAWRFYKLPPPRDGLTSGRMYVVECQGSSWGNHWLSGSGSAVGLTPDTTDPNPGTKWLATQTSAGWQFQCTNTATYLNGDTKGGGVGLDSNNTDSGTYWSLTPVGTVNADYVVTCLGPVPGPTGQPINILNGMTQGRSVGLVLGTAGNSGTTWRFYELLV
jgi:hypothetical protein